MPSYIDRLSSEKFANGWKTILMFVWSSQNLSISISVAAHVLNCWSTNFWQTFRGHKNKFVNMHFFNIFFVFAAFGIGYGLSRGIIKFCFFPCLLFGILSDLFSELMLCRNGFLFYSPPRLCAAVLTQLTARFVQLFDLGQVAELVTFFFRFLSKSTNCFWALKVSAFND